MGASVPADVLRDGMDRIVRLNFKAPERFRRRVRVAVDRGIAMSRSDLYRTAVRQFLDARMPDDDLSEVEADYIAGRQATPPRGVRSA